MAKLNNPAIITITTDFGDDFSLAQLKGVILSINPEARIITISNEISKFSVLEGAFVISQAAQFFPKGSIHVGVVDPGVGSLREGVIITTLSHIFVGPNNGLFAPAVTNVQTKKVFKISEKQVEDNCSNTFHGRDIFARVAGFLSLGRNPCDFSHPVRDDFLVNLEFDSNQVLHIDPYGNIKVNNVCRDLQEGDFIKLKTSGHTVILPFVKTFSDVPKGNLLLYKGSHGFIEIARNFGSANDLLRLEVGNKVAITKL